MPETERGEFLLKFERVDLSLADSVHQLLSLRGKGKHGAEESAVKGNSERRVSHRGQRHAHKSLVPWST